MVKTSLNTQQSLFPDLSHRFPSTRYQGSKAKLVDWIWENIVQLDFDTCLDAFGGTGSIAYRFKQEGKKVTYNDLLKFNYQFGLALLENNKTRLSREDISWILKSPTSKKYPSFVRDMFADTYFTDDENAWIDRTITNILEISDRYKRALAFFALCQACIIKRPYNLFHRKNLYIRLAEVERSFGNKTTWDTPFEEWFEIFCNEANQAVFDNGKMNKVINKDALNIDGDYDLVYIDTPYISSRGVGVNYLEFYHFLEGLAMYDEWEKHIDLLTKHRRLKRVHSVWTDKTRITSAFHQLFERFRDSVLVVSYRSDGIPPEGELYDIMKKYKQNVQVEHYGHYKYVLSKNRESREILIIGK